MKKSYSGKHIAMSMSLGAMNWTKSLACAHKIFSVVL